MRTYDGHNRRQDARRLHRMPPSRLDLHARRDRRAALDGAPLELMPSIIVTLPLFHTVWRQLCRCGNRRCANRRCAHGRHGRRRLRQRRAVAEATVDSCVCVFFWGGRMACWPVKEYSCSFKLRSSWPPLEFHGGLHSWHAISALPVMCRNVSAKRGYKLIES